MANNLTNSTGNVTCDIRDIFETRSDMIIKFPLIGVFASSVAVLGVFMNLLLTCTFLKNRDFRNSYILYLGAIAAGDMFRCASYFLIFGIEIYYNEFRQLYWMYEAWVFYTPHLFAVSRTAAMTVTYLLIAASTERYLAVKNQNYRSTVHVRVATIIIIISTSILYCMPMYFAIQIETNTACEKGTYGYVKIGPAPLIRTWSYGILYEVYFNNVLQIFLPFLTLLTLNFAIIVRLKSMLRLGNALFSRFAIGAEGVGRQQRNLRSATVTLIALITGYLVANIPSVVLKFVEQVIDLGKLSPEERTKHSFAVDSTTMLHIIYAAFRFMAYFCCNEKIRREFFAMMCWCRETRQGKEERLSLSRHVNGSSRDTEENGLVVVNLRDQSAPSVYIELV